MLKCATSDNKKARNHLTYGGTSNSDPTSRYPSSRMSRTCRRLPEATEDSQKTPQQSGLPPPYMCLRIAWVSCGGVGFLTLAHHRCMLAWLEYALTLNLWLQITGFAPEFNPDHIHTEITLLKWV